MNINYFEILETVREYFPKSELNDKDQYIQINGEFSDSEVYYNLAKLSYDVDHNVFVLEEKRIKEEITNKGKIGKNLDDIVGKIKETQIMTEDDLRNRNFKPSDILHYRNFHRE